MQILLIDFFDFFPIFIMDFIPIYFHPIMFLLLMILYCHFLNLNLTLISVNYHEYIFYFHKYLPRNRIIRQCVLNFNSNFVKFLKYSKVIKISVYFYIFLFKVVNILWINNSEKASDLVLMNKNLIKEGIHFFLLFHFSFLLNFYIFSPVFLNFQIMESWFF